MDNSPERWSRDSFRIFRDRPCRISKMYWKKLGSRTWVSGDLLLLDISGNHSQIWRSTSLWSKNKFQTRWNGYVHVLHIIPDHYIHHGPSEHLPTTIYRHFTTIKTFQISQSLILWLSKNPRISESPGLVSLQRHSSGPAPARPARGRAGAGAPGRGGPRRGRRGGRGVGDGLADAALDYQHEVTPLGSCWCCWEASPFFGGWSPVFFWMGG